MKTRVLWILTFLCLICVFTGCSLRQQIEHNTLLAQIDEAEKKWQEQGDKHLARSASSDYGKRWRSRGTDGILHTCARGVS